MKWISNFLKKNDARAATASHTARSPAAKPAQPTEDIDRLRDALAGATDTGERARITDKLGAALSRQSLAPRDEDAPEVWVAAICHAADKALALTWLARLNGEDAWLGEVAAQARGAEVRFAAVQRIGATPVLERVAQASRDKDKRVYRHCADLLRQRRQVEASDARATEISSEIQTLLDTPPLPLSRLLDLKKALAALDPASGPVAACEEAMRRAFAQLQSETEARRDLQACQRAAEALATECEHAQWPWAERIEGWRARLDTLGRSRGSVPAWLSGQTRALSEALDEIDALLAALASDARLAQARENFLDALPTDTVPDADTVAAWDALAEPDHPAARQASQDRWLALNVHAAPEIASEPAPAPAPAPAVPRHKKERVDPEALRQWLDAMELAVGQGHLADADAAAKQIKALLHGRDASGAQESRWHGLQSQLETLRGWARWGTGQARDQLIAAARNLQTGEQDVEELARAIAGLREEWKHLNAHGAASKDQWESFDAALEQAYLPVATHRAEQAARHAETRAIKDTWCAEWEAELAGMDWEHADFKLVEARRADLIKQWQAAPLAGFKDERALRKRFDGLIGEFDQRLDVARSAERERREGLIAEAEALGEQTDLGHAMAQAKDLQGRWSKQAIPVRLKRRDEEKLWQRFRAACNGVFERRDLARAEQEARSQALALARQMLLDDFAAALTDADEATIKHILARFRTDWEAARPAPRASADGLESRARDLQRRAQERLDTFHREKHRARFDLMARRAALAERIEASALAAEPLEPVLAEARRHWDELPRLPGKTQSLLDRRFAAASGATRATLAAGDAERKALLLDLEIALGLPSPEDFANLRRERQLSRLQDRFGAGPAQDTDTDALLVRWYATAALSDPVGEKRIEAVVRELTARAAAGTGT